MADTKGRRDAHLGIPCTDGQGAMGRRWRTTGREILARALSRSSYQAYGGPPRLIIDIEELKSTKFSLENRATAWLTYGGGQGLCPERHFNKHEMIIGLAVVITLSDIEPLDEKNEDMRLRYAWVRVGALLPNGKTPVRIRRSNRGTEKATNSCRSEAN